MLSSFGIRAYSIFIESFLAWAFINSIFIIHNGLGQRHSLGRLWLLRWHVWPAQCVLMLRWKCNRDRNEKPEVCEQERGRT